MVILKSLNPKTKETMVLPPFKLPPSYKEIITQSTAVEARHFAAAYALFRVCSMRNIHMMLPPTYRDLWKNEFKDLKAEDIKDGKGWMYEADPFTAKLEREEAQALLSKRRDERERQKVKETEQSVSLGLSHGNNTGATSRNVTKGWVNVPKIEMGKRIRSHIEELVRINTVWNPHESRISDFQQRNIIIEFTELGFRRSHVEEAVLECKDREEALEWLLIHVPEDDLPKWSLPEGYTAGISIGSGNLKREASVQRLAAAGYSMDLCEKLLDANDGHEGLAAQALQKDLVDSVNQVPTEPGIDISTLSVTEIAQGDSIWAEEEETLKAIFEDRFEVTSPDLFHVHLHVPDSKLSFKLNIRRSISYPQTAPVVSLTSLGLPAYIKLSIIRQTVNMANTEYLGGPMVFNLVDWLEHEIPKIIENPGSLRTVSAAVMGRREQDPTASAQRHLRFQKKPAPSISHYVGDHQSVVLLDRWRLKQQNPRQRKMLDSRKSLPAWALRDEVVECVNTHQVTIISGETGSGKSTQAVQFILDDMIQGKRGSAANIICTQPRRISTLSLADRVSEERCSPVGDEVGYAIRGESAQKLGVTKITFVTTGVLLRRLQTSGGTTDDVVSALADVSHVVVDEVHERSLDVDFLLVLLKTVLAKRKDFKVVLMSATLDARIFEQYFHQGSTVAKVEIQGRTFSVDDHYLDDVIRLTGFDAGSRHSNVAGGDPDDAEMENFEPSLARTIQTIGMRINYELIVSTIRAIDAQLGSQNGAILIFLPGVFEINRALDALRSIPNILGLPLHASLLPTEQRRVFPPAPYGKRKVIAATNVAETSITIEDIVAVIDLGKVKETTFDPQNNMVKLEEVWASRAACKQRRGRAGRVKAGQCFKLYTRNAEAKMAERNEPEIRRVPLEQISLAIRAMGIKDVRAFLASAITPPNDLAVDGALDLLERIGALDGDDLTALGRHLSMIPADMRCSKLMVYGATFGCLEACLTIAAILTVKSPFVSPQAKRTESKAARSSFAESQGDLLCDLRAYEEWSNMKTSVNYRDIKSWCDQNFLSSTVLQDIATNRSQYLASLKEAGFIPNIYPSASSTAFNTHHSNSALIRSLVAGAFNPQLARIDYPDKKFAPSMSGAVELDPEARTIKFFNQENGRVFVHPSSTLFDSQSFVGRAAFMSYFNKMATSKIFIRELTRKLSPLIVCKAFSPLTISFAGTKSIQCLLPPPLLWPNHSRHTGSRTRRRRLAAASWVGEGRGVSQPTADDARRGVGEED